MLFDTSITDELLATTRAVRKRLDLTRPVPREVINECLELAVQAPTASNSQTWRWLVIDDPDQKKALAKLYRTGAENYFATASSKQSEGSVDSQTQRVMSSAVYLMEHLHEVPALLIPCVKSTLQEPVANVMASSMYGSIYPAIWSFQLAARARGLGTALTTIHLLHEKEAAELLGIPDDITQIAMLPVAYTLGTDFKRAKRPPVANITHWNSW